MKNFNEKSIQIRRPKNALRSLIFLVFVLLSLGGLEAQITVTGSGCADGEYVQDGENNGKPYFRGQVEGNIYWSEDYGEWIMFGADAASYRNYMDTPLPPTSGWLINNTCTAGCNVVSLTGEVTAVASEPIALNSLTTTPLTCSNPAGAIEIDATANYGGAVDFNGDYLEYSIDNGLTWQAGNTFSGLAAGSYDVRIRWTPTSGALSGCEMAYANNPVVLEAPTCVTVSGSGCADYTCEQAGMADGKPSYLFVLSNHVEKVEIYWTSAVGSWYIRKQVFFGGGTSVQYRSYQDTPTPPATGWFLSFNNNSGCSTDCNAVSLTGEVSAVASEPITINQVTASQPTCADPAGAIEIDAMANYGGFNNGDYLEYSIDNGLTWQAGNTFSGLAAGSYDVKVKWTPEPGALSGCEMAYASNPVVIEEAPTCVTVSGSGCADGVYEQNGLNDGKPFFRGEDVGNIYWSGTEWLMQYAIGGGYYGFAYVNYMDTPLPPAFGWVRIIDINNPCTAGCNAVSLTGAVSAVASEPITINSVIITPPTCINPAGAIEIGATANYGGFGNVNGDHLEYSIDNGLTWQAGNIFSGLAAGSYDVKVKWTPQSGVPSGCEMAYTNNPVVIEEAPTCVTVSGSGCADGVYEQRGTNQGKPSFSRADGNAIYWVGAWVLDVPEEGGGASTAYVNYMDTPLPPAFGWVRSPGDSPCAAGCNAVSLTGEVSAVAASEPITINQVTASQPTCADPAGAIEIDAMANYGGFNNGDYLEYSIDNGLTWQAGNTFSGLAAGSYDVKVKWTPESGVPSGCEMAYTNNPVVLEAPTCVVTVSGSGCSDGEYEEGGMLQGKPSFERGPGSYIYWDGLKWVIRYNIGGGINSPSYYNYMNTPLPPESGWVRVSTSTSCTAGCNVVSLTGEVSAVAASEPITLNSLITTPLTCMNPAGSIGIDATANYGGLNNGDYLEYSIDNGLTWQADNTFSGLAAGSYDVRIRWTPTSGQPSGCEMALQFPIVLALPPVLPAFTYVEANSPSGCGETDGEIDIFTESSMLVFKYSIDGGASWQSNSYFGDLAPGMYNVVIRSVDDPTCTEAYPNNPVEVKALVPPTINSVQIGQPTCADPSGSISIDATDNNPIFIYADPVAGNVSGSLEFSIDNGASWQSSPDFTGLAGGEYNIQVRSAEFSGCVVSYSNNPVVISGAPAPDAYYEDADGDGFGNPNVMQLSCTPIEGYVRDENTDCNDTDPDEYPGQTWYKDTDGDGYSNGMTLTQCERPEGYFIATELTATTGDCVDINGAVNPGAIEICNGFDDDCDGYTDDDDPSLTGQPVWYRDTDNDGYGNPNVSIASCTQPDGYIAEGGDCNDSNPFVNPSRPELCNGVDDNCDGQVDESQIQAITVANVSSCNDMGTPADPSDDFFTADVTVTFTDFPTVGVLRILGDGQALVDVSMLSGNEYTFSGVTMAADGSPIELDALFSISACVFTGSGLGMAPAPCASCNVATIAVTNLGACENGGNTDPTDDTFTADVTITFTSPPSTGMLNVSGDATASIPVASIAGNSHTFSGLTFSADGGPISLTANFSADPSCSLSNPNLGTAIAPCCFVEITDISATPESCTGTGDGSLTISTTGTGALTYSIDGGASFQMSNVFTNLTAGSYTVQVGVQGEGCSVSGSTTINEGGTTALWYKDIDGDGYTDGTTQMSCTQPTGYVASASPGDCNDYDALQYPEQSWYADMDGDSYGTGSMTTACLRPAGHFAASELTATDGDCDDTNADVNPGAPEVCNGLDDNCDGQVDEGTTGGLTWNGNLLLDDQAAVDNFSSCYSVVNGNLTIKNSGVNSLANLSNLMEVTGNVYIKSTSLVNLTGLEALTTIGGYLRIQTNNDLTSLDGLENVTSVEGYLRVYYNKELTDCCAIHDLLENDGIMGSITITRNETGCDDEGEISMSCTGGNNLMAPGSATAGVSTFGLELSGVEIDLFPNPNRGQFEVYVVNSEVEGVLSFKDTTGRVLWEAKTTAEANYHEVSVQDLVPGIYFMSYTDGEEMVTQKVVVR